MSIDARVKALRKSEPTKAAIARALLTEKFSIAAISKAVPMSYSQVHSIATTMGKLASQDPERIKNIAFHTGKVVKPHKSLTAKNVTPGYTGNSDWGQAAKAPAKRSMKPMTSPVLDALKKGKPINVQTIGVTKRVGKLRTGGLPSDTSVGECANCGHDLVIRSEAKSGQMFFIHVNTTIEEYLNVTQFCHGVPKVLLA